VNVGMLYTVTDADVTKSGQGQRDVGGHMKVILSSGDIYMLEPATYRDIFLQRWALTDTHVLVHIVTGVMLMSRREVKVEVMTDIKWSICRPVKWSQQLTLPCLYTGEH